MALNYSPRPLFPAHISEDNLVSPMNRDWFSSQWLSSREVRDRGDSMDLENVLHADPIDIDIGMNIGSTVTAITGLIESLEYGARGSSKVGVSIGDSSLFAELNFLFSKSMDFHHPFSGDKKVYDKILVADTVDTRLCEELGHPFCNGGLNFVCTRDINKNSEKGDRIMVSKELRHPFDNELLNFAASDDPGAPHPALSDSDPDEGKPHEALGFALAYLGVHDLLSVERVCKSLWDSANDTLLWKNVHIDQPLNHKITDDILVQLTNRSQGSLQSLSLVGCQRITDDGLKRILESNLRLTKLSVPGCTRLSIDGIISGLRAFRSVARPGIKSLRIGAIHGVTQEHFDELMSLMGIQTHAQANRNKPLFFHKGNCYLSCEDERPIDIETCPKCQNLRLVYDCPEESCQGNATQACRGCSLCVPRCVECGKCIIDREYIENFCLELLCSVCWKQTSRCQERQGTQPSHSAHAVTQDPVSSFHG